MAESDRLLAAVVVIISAGASIPRAFRLPSKQIKPSPETRASRDDNPNSPSPDFAALIDTIRDQGRRNRNEERREDRSKKVREWLTILLLFVTVYFLNRQVIEMNRQVDEMIKAYEPIKVQADATKTAADISLKAQRAWIGPTNAKIDGNPIHSQGLKVTIDYTNSGKEPAVEVGTDTSVRIFTSLERNANELNRYALEKSSSCFQRRLLPGAQVVFPAAAYTMSFETDSNALSVDDRVVASQGLEEGNDYLAVTGCFVYKTIDVYHHTSFCFFYNKTKSNFSRLSICDVGSDAD